MSMVVSENFNMNNRFDLVAKMVKNFESVPEASVCHKTEAISCDTTEIGHVSRVISLYESDCGRDSFGNCDKSFGHESTVKKKFESVKLGSKFSTKFGRCDICTVDRRVSILVENFESVTLTPEIAMEDKTPEFNESNYGSGTNPNGDKSPKKEQHVSLKHSTWASDEMRNVSENSMSSETVKQGRCERFKETVTTIDEDGFVFEGQSMTKKSSETRRGCKLSINY